MFAFSPSSIYDSTLLRQPRHYRSEASPSPTYATNPRDRYLAALTKAEAAEAEYVAAIAKQKAIQRQKQEEEAAAARREAVALRRQRSDALHRQAALDGLYAQDNYPSYELYHTTSLPNRLPPHFSAQSEEEVLILRELEGRRRRQQEEKEVARVAAALQLKKREHAEAKQQAKLSRCSDQELLNLLSGHEGPEVHRTRSQALLPLAVSHLLQAWDEPPQLQTPKPALRTPSNQAPNVNQPQPGFLEFVNAIFGGLVGEEEDKAQRPQYSRHVRFPAQPQMPSSSASTSATPTITHVPVQAPTTNDLKVASLVNIFNGGADKDVQNNIYSTLQGIFGPIFGDTQTSDNNKCAAEVPKAEKHVPTQTPAVSTTATGALRDILQTRLDNEPETEVRETLQGLLGSIFNGASHSQAPSATETKAVPLPASVPTSTSGPSLIEQLEARLHHDPDVEIHDTIRAIFASLVSAEASTPASATSSAPTKVTPSTSTSTLFNGGKGKGKVTTVPEFRSTTTTSPTSKAVLDAMNAIHSIEDHFAVLTSEFSLPHRLDFSPSQTRPSSPSSDSDSLTSYLAYTSANAPVRYYEQALSTLLAQLDIVESHGNDNVRKTRKEVVARVESALEEVERAVRERFVQHQTRNAVADTADKSVVGVESTQTDVNTTELLAAPVGEIHVKGEERTAQDITEVQTAEDPATAPDTESQSLAVERATLGAESFTFPSGIDAHISNYDDGTSFTSTEEIVPNVTSTNSAPSYPFTPSSETAGAGHGDTEIVDTSPMHNQSLNIPKRATFLNGEELVVVEPHSEASDWSEVEA